MLTFWIALAFVAGAFMPLQSGVNSTLALQSSGAIWASLISFVVGSVTLFAVVLVARHQWPAVSDLKTAPWWAWTGGLMGALFVATSAFLAPRLGAATMIALFVAGQLAMSVVLDHFGWATFPEHSINLWRIIGVLMLFGGVLLIRFN
ncbi:DMT family transporter [Oceanospirillum sp. HFRX-1_2]